MAGVPLSSYPDAYTQMGFSAPPKRVGKQVALVAGAKITDFAGNQNVEDTNETFLLSNGTSIHEFLVENVTRFRASSYGNGYLIGTQTIELSSPVSVSQIEHFQGMLIYKL